MAQIGKMLFILQVFIASALTEADLATRIAQHYQNEDFSIELFNKGGISSNDISPCLCDYYKRMPASEYKLANLPVVASVASGYPL